MQTNYSKTTKLIPPNASRRLLSCSIVKTSGRVLKTVGLAAACAFLSAISVQAQPAITSVYPPALKQHTGEHLAFTVTATGSGPLTYQWYFQAPSQASVILAGQTASNIIVTNITTTNSGQYWVVVTDNASLSASNSSTLTVSPTYIPLSPTNLIVSRVGDGIQPLSGAKGNTLYFDQYTTSGTYVSTTMVLDKNVAGAPFPVLVAGAGTDALFEGFLTTSAAKQFLTFAGYDEVYPFTGSDVTLSSAHIRALGSLNAYGYYSVPYLNPGLYSGGAHVIRGCVSADMTNYWITGGAGAGGIKFVNTNTTSYATGNGLPTLNSSGPNPKVVEYQDGNVFFSDQNGANIGIFASIPAATPAASGNGAASVFVNQGAGGRPNDFAISPDTNTIYIADDRVFSATNAVAGGIERWDNLSGVWTFAYTIPTGAGATNGALGLNVDFSAHATWGQGITGAILYATTSPSVTNTLVKIQDNGPASIATVLAQAGFNQSLHGVRFGPAVQVPVTISKQPANQFATNGGSATFSVTAFDATGPFTYQWYKGTTPLANGTTGTGSVISGATASSLTISNVSINDCVTNYNVVVSNPGSSLGSANAGLDIQITINPQPADVGVAAGATATFMVGATGNGTLHYQWLKNGSPLSDGGNVTGSGTQTLQVANAQTSDIGIYAVAINDNFVATNISQGALLEIGTLGNGTGLLGQYWSNQAETPNQPSVFNGPPTLTRVDPTVDFNFGTGSPSPLISVDTFAVVWSGKVQPLYTDTYTFYARTDDGVRLFVNGQPLIDAWVNRSAAENSATIDLVAGQQYDIVMQYYESANTAVAQLSWSSTLEPKTIIPARQLYAAAPPVFNVQPIGATNVNENDTLVLDGGSVSGTPPISYQWFTNGVAIPGQTNTTLVFPNLPLGLSGSTFTLVASNSFGLQTNSGTQVYVSSGAPIINADVPFALFPALVGETITFPVIVAGTAPTYQWTFNGTNLVDNGRIIGSHSNVLTILQALESDAGTYQLSMSNSYGTNANTASMVSVTRIVFNDQGGWNFHGTGATPSISSNVLSLTDGNANEAVSSFVLYPLYIGAFRASFTYQDVNQGSGDGIAFVLQNASTGSNALGGNGGNLGYSGITPSAALELNVNSGSRGGIGYAFATNGLTGGNSGGGGAVGDAYSATDPVNLISGDPIKVTLLYAGGVLNVSLVDPIANTSFSTSLRVDLPAILHTNTAYVGFTGATSTTPAQQQVSDFFYTSLPSVLVASNNPANVTVSWPSVSAAGFVPQQSAALSTTNWSNVTNAIQLTNGQYQIKVTPSGRGEFYRLNLP